VSVSVSVLLREDADEERERDERRLESVDRRVSAGLKLVLGVEGREEIEV